MKDSFADACIKAQAYRIRQLEKEVINLKAKLEEAKNETTK